MMKQVMFDEARAHSCYADAAGMLDEDIYSVEEESMFDRKYCLRGKYGFFDQDWFVPVHYSTEIPVEGEQLQITDYEGKKTVITPRAIIKTIAYDNVYKVYAEECEDFYVVSVNS